MRYRSWKNLKLKFDSLIWHFTFRVVKVWLLNHFNFLFKLDWSIKNPKNYNGTSNLKTQIKRFILKNRPCFLCSCSITTKKKKSQTSLMTLTKPLIIKANRLSTPLFQNLNQIFRSFQRIPFKEQKVFSLPSKTI